MQAKGSIRRYIDGEKSYFENNLKLDGVRDTVSSHSSW